MKNVLVVLSGPSGVGKGTIAKKLVKRNKDFFLSVSCTTRSPRNGETNGLDYFFISKPEFKEKINNDGFLDLTCFKIPVKGALELAHKYNATLTVFMSAVIMQALLNLQNEKNPTVSKQKLIKLSIPINLRSLFPCNTLRNFSMYTIPQIDPRLGEYSLEEICDVTYLSFSTCIYLFYTDLCGKHSHSCKR